MIAKVDVTIGVMMYAEQIATVPVMADAALLAGMGVPAHVQPVVRGRAVVPAAAAPQPAAEPVGAVLPVPAPVPAAVTMPVQRQIWRK